jgi:carbamoyl-phosphate synthase small subunit
MGNYGVPSQERDAFGIERNFESGRIWARGLVAQEACWRPSHHASVESLPSWLERSLVPGVEGIDTRRLTQHLRDSGTMGGRIEVEGSPQASAEEGAASLEPRLYGSGSGPLVALVDCGVKNNILRCLLSRGLRVLRLPCEADFSGLEYDGILLSNGPGDPKSYSHTIAFARLALRETKPVFGICLGNQIMALAAGGDTYKLPYGHRGQNQPCVELGSGRCYITSQNHGYAVRGESLPAGWETWFVNGNDGTIEGIRSREGPFYAVQFHPEGCPGPRDTEYLFDRFAADLAVQVGYKGRAIQEVSS